MAFPAIRDIKWRIRATNVSWARRTEAGKLQTRKQLAMQLEADADGLDTALYHELFVRCPELLNSMTIWAGSSVSDSLGNKYPQTPLRIPGLWHVENLDVEYDAGTAKLRLSVWQYTSVWQDVVETHQYDESRDTDWSQVMA